MHISDGKIALRDFLVDDIHRKIEWINDPKNHKYLHYEIPLEYDKTLQWFYGRDLSKRQDLVVEYEGVPVGVIGLVAIDRVNKKAEYYITIGAHEHKHKGIATVASRLLLEYAFHTLQLNKVYLNVDSKNTAACTLYEKIGMVCEGEFLEDLWHRGELIDRKRYAILKSAYIKQK